VLTRLEATRGQTDVAAADAATREFCPAPLSTGAVADILREHAADDVIAPSPSPDAGGGKGWGLDPSCIALHPLAGEALRWSVDDVGRHVGAGSKVPGFRRLPRLLRGPARLTARCLLLVARLVTDPQRRFNEAVRSSLQALATVARGLDARISYHLRTAQQAHERRLQDLERELAQAQEDLARQAARVSLALARNPQSEIRNPKPIRNAKETIPKPESGQVSEFADLEDPEHFDGYLQALRQAEAGTIDTPILDLGCGRGEWLDLLQRQGLTTRGVDVDPELVRACREHGLEVAEAEACEYLRSLPDACLGAVTALHLIEHLPPGALMPLLDETVRVLLPGGLAVFDSLNPENLVVGGSTFYTDPTRRQPVHPEALRLLAEARGLVAVELHRFGSVGKDPLESLPWHHPMAGALNPLIATLKRLLFAPSRYAVLGRKVRA
jgi:SAM-dependent methyltransferase